MRWRSGTSIFTRVCWAESGKRKAVSPDFASEKRLEALGARCRVIRLDPLVISSTQVRERITKGEALDGLVPPQVEQYIQEHGLYQKET